MACPWTGKVRHKSKGAAEAHLRHLIKIDDERVKNYEGIERAHAYPCPRCLGWHIGRKKEKAG